MILNSTCLHICVYTLHIIIILSRNKIHHNSPIRSISLWFSSKLLHKKISYNLDSLLELSSLVCLNSIGWGRFWFKKLKSRNWEDFNKKEYMSAMSGLMIIDHSYDHNLGNFLSPRWRVWSGGAMHNYLHHQPASPPTRSGLSTWRSSHCTIAPSPCFMIQLKNSLSFLLISSKTLCS